MSKLKKGYEKEHEEEHSNKNMLSLWIAKLDTQARLPSKTQIF